MLGTPGAGYHFEFTYFRNHPVVPSATPEDLAIFYMPDAVVWQNSCAQMTLAGFKHVSSLNPYWDMHGRTFQDHDGYRVVLQNLAWSP
jgi:hypothetical protein